MTTYAPVATARLSAARFVIDPFVIVTGVACAGVVLLIVRGFNLYSVAVLAALTAGWSSAWSP